MLAERAAFMSSAAFEAALAFFEARFGEKTLRRSRRLDHPYESSEDAALDVVLELIEGPRLCRQLIASAQPMGLLWSEICRMVGRYTGRSGSKGRLTFFDALDDLKLASLELSFGDPLDLVSGRVAAAAALTVATLQQKTPLSRQRHVPALVSWLAVNPVQRRSYVASEMNTAGELFPELSRGEISAVANITWGSRNQEDETSVLRWYLRHPDTPVKSSATHLAALIQFQSRMRQAVPRSLVLA
ncbi:hypothetical protein [Plantibacter sp. CFBP 8804]|uniref:hypothetical protein n=1 Tax=Plantibacter sp. CFBP 8804 TaxID=2775270 RepID=UPI001785A9A2|nr:hypothetical protein [Plantibacter sp. CFBP 8804]MBD8518861.1 hypothetical protein [Plantibacter sp. CFBP 8804]